ncbi:hypothetical protein [uncultured Pseudacidovorax sp.]|uniref:hypothetical protein n=1 Tax=uncultured Pseudacidovorax sp. TaxID=679313 RepID=UPI0025FC6B7C|nr:hypothetical protein [uncultured Pseudacidovorax sp.]
MKKIIISIFFLCFLNNLNYAQVSLGTPRMVSPLFFFNPQLQPFDKKIQGFGLGADAWGIDILPPDADPNDPSKKGGFIAYNLAVPGRVRLYVYENPEVFQLMDALVVAGIITKSEFTLEFDENRRSYETYERFADQAAKARLIVISK